ncbi:hypothetical protein MJI37_33015, partial [Salmonella enterica subsp. enterica serovar Cerro]|nr:hypothetical protein [Salmonella enterica subsp. enterica serovar Cerro]
VVKDSVLTSGAYSDLGTDGFYGQGEKPSDYSGTADLWFSNNKLFCVSIFSLIQIFKEQISQT